MQNNPLDHNTHQYRAGTNKNKNRQHHHHHANKENNGGKGTEELTPTEREREQHPNSKRESRKTMRVRERDILESFVEKQTPEEQVNIEGKQTHKTLSHVSVVVTGGLALTSGKG